MALMALAGLCALNDNHAAAKGKGAEEIIYVQTNDFNSGGNAVLAYRNNGKGKLKQIGGSPFKTGGSGVGNPMQMLGPSDSDFELWLTGDKRFLLAVNSGSNNITVFRVAEDGGLSPVPGSPFSSGGETPVSVCESGGYVYVVNKSQNPESPTSSKPNYTTFRINADGQLSPVDGAKLETTMGTSPALTLLSNDKRFAFGTDFLGFMVQPPVGTLRAFTLRNGALSPVGEPMNFPEKGGALGLWQHPSANVLYVGFPLAGKVGVYNINPKSGALTYSSALMAGPAACWLRTNKSGSHLYALNSGENTISEYNSTNAESPKPIGKLALKQAGPTYMDMGMPFKTSQDFAFALSSDEKCMYVVCQHTNKDFSIGNYNYLHMVDIADDGTLSESSEPVQLPVANTVRPKGAVVYMLR